MNIVSARSAWKSDLTRAPLATNSAAQVANLDAQVKKYYGGVAAFNVNQYNPSWYTVPARQAVTTVQFSNCQNKSYIPRGLFGPGGQFVDVPVPNNSVPANGTDASMTIYRPATDQLWSFWKMQRSGDTWSACWGGRIDSISTSPGYFSNGFGAAASGLASELGAVSIREARAGQINHALTLTLPTTAHWKRFSWPAQRSDGDDHAPDAIAEGTRFRLNPKFNVDALKLTPIAKMMAKAAQTYGFIVTDRSGCVAVTAESGVPLLRATGTNPWIKLMEGVPSYSIMKNFPWSQLQALPPDYGKPGSG